MRINWTKPKAFQNYIYKSGMFCLSPECDGWSPRPLMKWNASLNYFSLDSALDCTVSHKEPSPTSTQSILCPEANILNQHLYSVLSVEKCIIQSHCSRVTPPESPGYDPLYKHVIISRMQWNTCPRGRGSWKWNAAKATEQLHLQTAAHLLWEKCLVQMTCFCFIFIQSCLSFLNHI